MNFNSGEAMPKSYAHPDEAIAPPGRYQPSRQPRWIWLVLIALIHAAGFVALRYVGPGAIRRAAAVPLVVDLLPLAHLPPPPQQEPIALPSRQEPAPLPVPQRIVAPVPIVTPPPAPVVVATPPRPQPEPPTPTTVKVEDARPAPSRAADTMVNLHARLLSADPPRYPVEARRRRETGTVILLVLVDEQGRVSAISVATSSGVDRLDKAALAAVRRWRWSPTTIDGQPRQVRGLVRIPFELKDP